MTFDKTQPTDTTKIRNLGVVIRPNWEAIEEAASSFKPYATNYQTRTDLGVSNDPAQISGASIAYCKDDAAGNAELYSINENGDVAQLTRGSVNAAATGHTFLPGGLIMNWGEVTGTPAGATATFSRAFTTGMFSMTATSFNTGTSDATISGSGLNSRTIYTVNTNQVYYIAIGF